MRRPYVNNIRIDEDDPVHIVGHDHVRIPSQADHRFRRKLTTCSEPT